MMRRTSAMPAEGPKDLIATFNKPTRTLVYTREIIH